MDGQPTSLHIFENASAHEACWEGVQGLAAKHEAIKMGHTGSIGYPWVSKNLMVEIVLLYLIIYHYYYIIMIIISYYILSSCSPRKQLTIAHHFEDFPRGYRGHVWPWNLPPRSLWYQTL